MNIAVIFTKDATEGGAFQYALSVAHVLKESGNSKLNFIFFTTLKKNIGVLKKYNINAIYLPWSNFDRLMTVLFGSQLLGSIFTKLKMKLESKLDRIFRKYSVDLVYFISPTDLALALNRYNYVFTILDLCFLDSMEFPEVYANKEFERRDKLYRLATNKAIAVITDSEINKLHIIKRYGAAENRVIPLPFLPSMVMNISPQDYDRDFIDINKKYMIGGKYIFYPAQFWPHKNHIYILEGLKLLKEKYKITLEAVFTGSDKGNLAFVLKRAKELGVGNQIHYIGFVDDNELPYLYGQALALVMPTYFGPTNIPPLEAFAMGCPVLYSDLPGLRDQVKDAALPLDLKNPDTMCQGLSKIIERSPEISLLISNGKKKIESLKSEASWKKLNSMFDDYAVRINCR